MFTVCKFGGSSVADSTQFKKIKDIVLADDRRRLVVVSAMGRRNKEDYKVTDMLYLTYAHVKYGGNYKSILDVIRARYQEAATELNLDYDVAADFDKLEQRIQTGCSEEFLVSRGEYFCAKLMAAYLGYEFVDAADVVHFRYDGTVDDERTSRDIAAAFGAGKRVVIPGFYGSYPSGEVKLFSRGGSDITGAIVAKAVSADKYENWTDVSGVYMADPRIVDNPRHIAEVTYDELRELSYMGASVLHEETILPIREINIPIYILNTNAPQDKGTKICKDAAKSKQAITGIAGKKNFKAFTIVKDTAASKLKVIQAVLDIFDRFGVPVEHIPTSIDSFNVIVESKYTEKVTYDILTEIAKLDEVVSVDIDNDLALVAVVGRNMVTNTGISGAIFSIFGKHGINIKTIAQGTREINITVGIANADFEKCIRAIYEDMV